MKRLTKGGVNIMEKMTSREICKLLEIVVGETEPNKEERKEE